MILVLLLLLSCSQGAKGDGGLICGQSPGGTIEIKRGEATVGSFNVALAASPQSQRKGLMACPELVPATGMLFVYPQGGKRVFWMKNTLIELAIIFISDDGQIAAIAHGQPESLERLHSPENIRYVLEINFAESHTLAVGDQVDIHFLTE